MTGKEMMMHAASPPPTFLKQCVSTINDHGRTRISLILPRLFCSSSPVDCAHVSILFLFSPIAPHAPPTDGCTQRSGRAGSCADNGSPRSISPI